jgi:hypothetical protein
MRGLSVRLAPVGVIAVLFALSPLAVAAHEQRDTPSGSYSLTVGFLNEPAYLGQANAVYLEVVEYGSDGGPVEGLSPTLAVDVQKDGATATFEFLPGAEPGQYVAPFYPTATGDYTFRIHGQIEEEAIDESFRSSPNTFNPVEPLTSVQFPVAQPDPVALEAQVEDAEDAAATARALAIAGLVIGVLGVGFGFAAWFGRGRGRGAAASADTASADPTVSAPTEPDNERFVARRSGDGGPPNAPTSERS